MSAAEKLLDALGQNGASLTPNEEVWIQHALSAAYEQGAQDMRERAAKEATKRAELGSLDTSSAEFDRGWWSAARCIEDEINLLPTTAGRTEG